MWKSRHQPTAGQPASQSTPARGGGVATPSPLVANFGVEYGVNTPMDYQDHQRHPKE
jgi:hypothetical protein